MRNEVQCSWGNWERRFEQEHVLWCRRFKCARDCVRDFECLDEMGALWRFADVAAKERGNKDRHNILVGIRVCLKRRGCAVAIGNVTSTTRAPQQTAATSSSRPCSHRSWVFEVSNDKSEGSWEVVDSRENNSDLNAMSTTVNHSCHRDLPKNAPTRPVALAITCSPRLLSA